MCEALVAEAFDTISKEFGEALDNVAVVVEDWPDQETLRLAGVRAPMQLLGFYHGTPKSRRGYGYNLVPPDKISIYRQPIERRCHTEAELRAMIERVLRHEIAHHFGIDDERLHEIGAY